MVEVLISFWCAFCNISKISDMIPKIQTPDARIVNADIVTGRNHIISEFRQIAKADLNRLFKKHGRI
jgi:hypothetical protein